MTKLTSTSTGVVLGSTDTNPVDIAAGTKISNTGGTAISDGTVTSASAFTIVNSGIVTGSLAMELGRVGDTVTNAAGGVISATSAGFGVRFLTDAADGTVVNDGTISSALHSGVAFISGASGGLVTNNSDGLITGLTQGVYLEGGSVTNAGTITGTSTTSSTLGFGINLKLGADAVTNEAGGVIRGVTIGISDTGTSAAIDNSGLISATGAAGVGISLKSETGTLTNETGGTISGTATGIYGASGVVSTISNAGLISGTGTAGVGVSLKGGTDTLANATGGTISGTVFGVYGGSSTIGSISNAGLITGTGSAGIGIDLLNGGTITDSGQVVGTGGTAVYLGGSDYNLLTLQPGATFTGTVMASANAFNTLEVSDPSGGPAALSGLGTEFVNFNAVELDAGVNATLSGSNTLIPGTSVYGNGTLTNTGTITTGTLSSGIASSQNVAPAAFVNDGTVSVAGNDVLSIGAPVSADAGQTGTFQIQGNGVLEFGAGVDPDQTVAFAGNAGTLLLDDSSAFGATVAGFVGGDGLDLGDIIYSSDATASLSGDTLTVTTDYGAAQVTLSNEPANATFSAVQDQTGGVLVEQEVACFCRGTLIRTPGGDVPVERLASGDAVTTLSGEARPLTWIGSGRSLVTPANPGARPIVVRRGALADGVPARDLYLTKGHSLLVDGVLIPVEFLVNDRSIAWDDTARVVEYYHLELARHDVLLAEGAAAESYRDDDNRHLFHNSDLPRHSDAEMAHYAPVLTGGPEVDRAWARLLARAGGGETALTDDSDLHLLADGARVDGEAEGMVHRFRLDRAPFELRIRSRVCNPTRLGTVRDPRDLGVALRRLTIRGGGTELVLSYDSPWLTEGYNGAEPSEAIRWTTGDGVVPGRVLAAFDGPVELELQLGMATRYPLPAAARPQPAPLKASA